MDIINFLKSNYVIASGIIGILIGFFNKENNKNETNITKYYNEFLIIFFDCYKRNRNINLKKFYYKNFYNQIQEHIPGYVHYLLQRKYYRTLKKILIADYFNYQPTLANSMTKSLKKITTTVYYFYYLLSSIMMAYIIVVLIPAIGNIVKIITTDISYTTSKFLGFQLPVSIVNIILLAFMIIFFFLLVLLIYFYCAKNEVYTYEEKTIKKVIMKKLKYHKKLKKKIYLIKN